MSINLTDEIDVKTKKGKLGAAKQIFLEGDTQTVEKEIQDINSRHNTLNTKHESLSRTVQGIAVTGGASTATNVTYNNGNSGLNAENTQDAIDELQGSKIDKTSILQESGNAEDKVMSQKAVSDKLSDLDEKTSNVIANYKPTSKWTQISLIEGSTYTIKVIVNTRANAYQIAYNHAGTAQGATYILGTATGGALLDVGEHTFEVTIESPCGAIQVSQGGSSVAEIDNVYIEEKDWTPSKAVNEEAQKRQSADNALSTRVGQAEASIVQLSKEPSDRQKADTYIQTQIDEITTTIEKRSDNLLNLNGLLRGYLYSSSAYFTTDSGMWLTNKINVEGHSKITIEIASTLQPAATFAVAFSSVDTFSSYIDGLHTFSAVGAHTLDIPSGAKYMIMSINNSESIVNKIIENGVLSQIQYGSEIKSYEPYVEPSITKEVKSNGETISARGGFGSLGERIDFIESKFKDYVTVGSSGCDYTSITKALKSTDDNVKVIVKNGIYNIYQEYKEYFGTDYWNNYTGYSNLSDPFDRGLWMGKGRVIEGESQTLIKFQITDALSTTALNAIKTYFSIIADVADDNALINLTFEGDGNLRYLIHDDFTGYVTQIAHGTMLYQNCIFKGTTNTRSYIGGGTGRYNTYIVKDCIFLSDPTMSRDAFWHNNVNGDSFVRIFVNGCYGSKKLTFMHNGASTKVSECYVSNCKFSEIGVENANGNQYSNENMSLTKWNCIEDLEL